MPSDPPSPTPATLLRSDIAQAGGAISFARFMQRALYEPGIGYYERRPDVTGRTGDFYTSVSVGALFGELLAFRLARWFRAHLPDTAVELVEAGAHDGRLARDILSFLRDHAPDVFGRCHYRIVEPSAVRTGWQRERLGPFGERVSWSAEMPAAVTGAILSNELLDAFPVERWLWNAANRRWVEQGVAWDGQRFVWCPLPTAAPADLEVPDELAAVLPDGFARERSPGAVAWWTTAARALKSGWLITCDYGGEREELLSPARARGTLRGYHQHRLADDVLTAPGEIDLTAHVDFSAIRDAGETAGLRTVASTSQRSFLSDILAETQTGGFPQWDAGRVRQFQTLTHPEHLGRAFRVLAQQTRGA
jgi:SAM-dependent MidA family methyltransferase